MQMRVGALTNELEAQVLVFEAELKTVGLGLPPLLPADSRFGGNQMRFLKQRPTFFQLPFEHIVQQGAVGAACGECVVQGLMGICIGSHIDKR